MVNMTSFLIGGTDRLIDMRDTADAAAAAKLVKEEDAARLEKAKIAMEGRANTEWRAQTGIKKTNKIDEEKRVIAAALAEKARKRKQRADDAQKLFPNDSAARDAYISGNPPGTAATYEDVKTSKKMRKGLLESYKPLAEGGDKNAKRLYEALSLDPTLDLYKKVLGDISAEDQKRITASGKDSGTKLAMQKQLVKEMPGHLKHIATAAGIAPENAMGLVDFKTGQPTPISQSEEGLKMIRALSEWRELAEGFPGGANQRAQAATAAMLGGERMIKELSILSPSKDVARIQELAKEMDSNGGSTISQRIRFKEMYKSIKDKESDPKTNTNNPASKKKEGQGMIEQGKQGVSKLWDIIKDITSKKTQDSSMLPGTGN